jgi:AraC family transcriptional regulator, regulatory protein of adaptative response / methylated-DNA-[protein]-cysteine methyltransferase
METIQNKNYDYERIEKAIRYLAANFTKQPSLDELAGLVHVSPFHFQRMFHNWAGVSPKKFLQFLTADYAKTVLADTRESLSRVASDAGLSGTGRLHDLFVSIEAMTPGMYKNGASGIEIKYHFYHTPFGRILIASTSIGICQIQFTDNEDAALKKLASEFNNARLILEQTDHHKAALSIFNKGHSPVQMKIHLKGTPFQVKVWEALLKIPSGKLTTYGDIAARLNQPGAARAAGSAVGSNPVAYLIPCHRVIRSTGILGDYMWGSDRKKAIIGWEAAQLEKNKAD